MINFIVGIIFGGLFVWLFKFFVPPRTRNFITPTTIENLPVDWNYSVITALEVTDWIGDSYKGYAYKNLLVLLHHPETISWHKNYEYGPRKIYALTLATYSKDIFQCGKRVEVVKVNDKKCLEIKDAFDKINRVTL